MVSKTTINETKKAKVPEGTPSHVFCITFGSVSFSTDQSSLVVAVDPESTAGPGADPATEFRINSARCRQARP